VIGNNTAIKNYYPRADRHGPLIFWKIFLKKMYAGKNADARTDTEHTNLAFWMRASRVPMSLWFRV
jgi:hypothetical protein